MGVLVAPPLPLTTAMVRGPAQCWATAAASARSARSRSVGARCSPNWFRAPRRPVAAGASLVISVSSDVERACSRGFGGAADGEGGVAVIGG